MFPQLHEIMATLYTRQPGQLSDLPRPAQLVIVELALLWIIVKVIFEEGEK